MAEVKTFNIDLLTLDDIEIGNASISNNSGISELQIGTYAFVSKYSVKPALNFEYNKIRIEFNVDIDVVLKAVPPAVEEETTDIKANFRLLYYFGIPEIKDFVEINNEEVIIMDDDLSYSILNVVYSTSRGIVFTRCQGTIFNRNILPILSQDRLYDTLIIRSENKG